MKKRTHEDFLEDVFAAVKDEYTVLGQFVRMKDHVHIRHETCGREYKVTPDKFLNQGRRCLDCSRKRLAEQKKFTHQEFEQKVSEIDSDYMVIGKYQNSQTSLEMLHKKCGTIYNVRPNNFLVGKRCPHCAKQIRADKRRKSQEIIRDEIKRKYQGSIELIGEYKTRNNQTTFFCKSCNNCFSTTTSSLLNSKYGCPYCANIKQERHSLGHEQFIKRLKDKYEDEYVAVGEYKNIDMKIMLRHEVCGLKFEKTPYDFFKSPCPCPDCLKRRMASLYIKDVEEYAEQVHQKFSGEFSVFGEYTGANNSVLIKHNGCGRVFEAGNASSFLRQGTCRFCKESRGERRVRKFLEERKVDFITQYTFDDLVHVRKLKFDFAIFESGQLLLLIEYDGETHYHAAKYFGGADKLAMQKKLDSLKTDYCERNGIDLLRIPYWDYENIETIISRKINIHQTQTAK